jgi:hypothetical protein
MSHKEIISECPICNSNRKISFKHKILNKYEVNYLSCEKCGLLQTEQPYWLDEAYDNAIADSDTGLVARNISISKKLACVLFSFFEQQGKYLDVGGGYGLLTRLMRDIGFDFYWSDPYCENILAKGFESSNANNPFSAITAFELLEHIHNPLEFIKKSLDDAGTSTIIFSTELFRGNLPSLDWRYYSFETGQHISFYQERTLQFVADKLSLSFYSCKNFHIITDKRINRLILIIMISRFSSILYKFFSRKIKSKTLTDNNSILAKIYQ